MTHNKYRILFFLVLLATSATELWALNPLHEAKYQFYPTKFKLHRTEFGVGALTHFESDANVPINFVFGLNNSLEFGARVNLDSQGKKFNNENLDLRADLGLLANLRNSDLLQIDFLFGLGSSGQEGLNVSYTIFQGVTKRFSVAWQVAASFMDGLNGDEFTIVEFGFYPKFKIAKPLHFIGSFTYSSSPVSIKEYSAFDVAPGLEFNLASASRIFFLAYFGAAGDHSEGETLWKLGWIHDF